MVLLHPDTRTEAAESIRGLIDASVLTPADAFRLKPEATGDGDAEPTTVSTRAGRRRTLATLTIGQIAMVTGACNQLMRSRGVRSCPSTPDSPGRKADTVSEIPEADHARELGTDSRDHHAAATSWSFPFDIVHQISSTSTRTAAPNAPAKSQSVW